MIQNHTLMSNSKSLQILETCSIKNLVCQILFINQRINRQRKTHPLSVKYYTSNESKINEL